MKSAASTRANFPCVNGINLVESSLILRGNLALRKNLHVSAGSTTYHWERNPSLLSQIKMGLGWPYATCEKSQLRHVLFSSKVTPLLLPPYLRCELARFVRKMGRFGKGLRCKSFIYKEINFFGFFTNRKIAHAQSVPFSR